MSESGLDRERYLLSDTESRRIFAERIVPTEFAGIAGVHRPVVHFFGGQPGAGKSVAQGAVTTAIIAADGIGAVASIIGDDFRPHHPAYNRLLAEDDEAAAFYTDLDSGRWFEQAIAWAIERRPHVILEGTFRRPEVTIESAKNFADSGFEAHVHVLAVTSSSAVPASSAATTTSSALTARVATRCLPPTMRRTTACPPRWGRFSTPVCSFAPRPTTLGGM